MASFPLAGRTILVTGASSGIGMALARALGREGARLVLTARRADRLERLAAEIAKDAAANGGNRPAATGGQPPPPPAPHVIPADLAAQGAPEELLARARQAAGPIEILINNAGFARYGPFYATDLETITGILRVNIEALVRLTRLALPEMVARRGGAVLNVASTAGFVPLPYMATYAATKAFVVSFSQAVHAEVREHGVRVVCLCPGRTRTEFFDVARYGPTARLPLDRSGMSAAAVAEEGLSVLRSGAPVSSAGGANRLMVGALRFLPRRLMLGTAAWLLRLR
jgi:short-subunit dehydrogenase